MLDAIDLALEEDLGSGDLTTAAVVPEGARALATIEQRAPGVPAGLEVAAAVFGRLDPEIEFSPVSDSGGWREPGPLAEVSGAAAPILAGERVALNFLGRLSGIATLTARYVQAVAGTGARILDTRKTTPGLRTLEKEAVRAGGGTNHRQGLYDAVLVKENHSALAGGVAEATRRALEASPPGVTVEVECADLAEVDEALAAGAGRLLLDNMDPVTLRRAVEVAAGRAELEASGGITLDNVRAVAESGVGWISIGALTHSAPALDVSLMVRPG
ncbi:MAG TPA: carboxylating nicotinate-nucleotide diphosphorylase [Thermoleophilaceae bacterium]|nr:carboxylating nicotinate-nucleotide diphosphorylase [Thermoleophilaceae bacterium]